MIQSQMDIGSPLAEWLYNRYSWKYYAAWTCSYWQAL